MVVSMTFTKINDYTVQCVIAVKEIDQMGYALNELYTNKEAASKFMRNVMEKGEEAGFQLNHNLQEIQVVLLPDGQLVLSFTEVSPDYQVNQMIENAIEAYDAVESIGKEQLEEIKNLSGREKLLAFQDIMAKYKGMAEAFLSSDESDEEEKNLEKTDIENKVKNKFMFEFSDLSHLEKLCKAVTLKVPSHLYKDNKQYYLLTDFSGINQEKIASFMMQALDFAVKIENNELIQAHVEEHAKPMIENKAIEILKRI
jgi:negative regulator of genetic competence, sporulation and motility